MTDDKIITRAMEQGYSAIELNKGYVLAGSNLDTSIDHKNQKATGYFLFEIENMETGELSFPAYFEVQLPLNEDTVIPVFSKKTNEDIGATPYEGINEMLSIMDESETQSA
jgi:hypothetical protein